MEILWPALGISAIIGVAFYALTARWQRILRQQSRAGALSERVRDLEEINDPQFRGRLAESSPMPLVWELSMRFAMNFEVKFEV